MPGIRFITLQKGLNQNTSTRDKIIVPPNRYDPMKKNIPFAVFALFIFYYSHGQNPWELGVEYQRSIGKGFNDHLGGVRYENFKQKGSFSLGIQYQFSSQKSYSVSRGYALYLGYRYAFSNNFTGNTPFVGARIRFSLQNFDGKTSLNSLLITPSAEAGYHFIFAKRFFGAPMLGYGYTIKLSKDYNSLDEDIGGRILPGLSAGYRF